MKKTIVAASSFVLLLLLQSVSWASANQFTGTWINSDTNTRGITKLEIMQQGSALRMHAWGKCQPDDCDWGEVAAAIYASSVSGNMMQTGKVMSAIYTTGFNQTLIVVKPAGKNRLKAETFTRFTDGSNRSNYTNTYTFKRMLQLMPLPIPTLPVPVIQEDCISFNPQTATVKKINGSWKIVDGNHWMFDFGNKKNEAYRSLKIIKHYGMNQSCFVGRPDPSFQYMLVSGQAPQGGIPGEDCIGFNPNTIEVKNINGRWKIVDGDHWMFDFGNKKAEAEKAFAIIKKYGFNRTCYVGRPNASFQYLRK